jgi:tRNA-modifying protein YgfZ
MTHSHLGLILISGSDAEKFLQGQLTCDVREATSEPTQLGAYCNAQGRIQTTFRLSRTDNNTYFMHLPLSIVKPTLTLLQKYALFSKITLTEAAPIPVTADWELNNILAGIPTIYPETIGLFTPHMLNYDKLNGISFNKGCYMGQEIVARTQYLGQAKQHLYQVKITTAQSPQPGEMIYTPEQVQVGTVVNAALDPAGYYQLLVVLKDAFATETHFRVGDRDILFEKK